MAGAVLLVMGISNDALGWPQPFIDGLVDAGFQVIRYDHRDTGLSDWDVDGGYSLADMAADAVAVLDALGVEQAHVVGVSMGGMIVQTMAIEHPDRILFEANRRITDRAHRAALDVAHPLTPVQYLLRL